MRNRKPVMKELVIETCLNPLSVRFRSAFRITTPLMQTASYPMALTQISAKNLLRGLKLRGGFETGQRTHQDGE